MIQNINYLTLDLRYDIIRHIAIKIDLMSIIASILIIVSAAIHIHIIDSHTNDDDSGSSSPPTPQAVIEESVVKKWDGEIDQEIADQYRTDEYERILGGAYDAINLADAYSLLEQNEKNIAGDGVIVGVIDSGINIDHSEFQGKIVNFTHSDNRIDDVSGYGVGHGSHVSGIIAASKDNNQMHGVAYNANIAPYKIFGDNSQYYSVSSAINQANADGVKIVNMSLSSSGNHFTALLDAKNNNILSTIATGNYYGSDPVYPARYAIDPELQGSIIAVGNYQSYSDSKSSSSNECGVAKDYCLFAPGTFLYSTYYASGGVDDRYNYLSGTSMAAPVVAGAASILKSAWPHLTNLQISDILLSTATDIGDPGTDDVFGKGLLNVSAAVNSYGGQNINATNVIGGTGYELGNTNLYSSAVLGDAFANKVAPIIANAVYFDDYGRDYKANLDQKIYTTERQSQLAGLVFGNNDTVHLPIKSSKSSLQLKLSQNNLNHNLDDDVIDLSFVADQNSYFENKNNARTISLSFSNELQDGLYFGFASNDYVNAQPGLENGYFLINNNTNYLQNIINSNSDNLQPIEQKSFFAKHEINDNISSTFSYQINSQSAGDVISGVVSKIAKGRLDFESGDNKVNVNYSNLTEYQDRALGVVTSGAFASNDNSQTDIVEVNGKNKIMDNIYLTSSYVEGRTKIAGNDNGIFRKFSTAKSSGLSVAILHDDFLNGKLAIKYSEPLRVYDAKVDIDIPIARDLSGNITRLQADNVDLEPSGKQRNIELSYGSVNKNTKLQFNVMLIQEPNHIADSQDEYIYYLNYHKRF